MVQEYIGIQYKAKLNCYWLQFEWQKISLQLLNLLFQLIISAQPCLLKEKQIEHL